MLVKVHCERHYDTDGYSIHTVLVYNAHCFNNRVQPVDAAEWSHAPKAFELKPRSGALVWPFWNNTNVVATHTASCAANNFLNIMLVKVFATDFVGTFKSCV